MRRRVIPRRPAARSGWHGPLRASEEGCAAGRNEASEHRGYAGDEEREAHGDRRRGEDYEVRETGEGRERDHRVRGGDPERGSEDRSGEGEDDGLRLVDAGQRGGGEGQSPDGRGPP